MLVYFVMSVTPLVLTPFFPNINNNKRQKQLYCILVALVLFIFVGLRSKFLGSTDTYNYYNTMDRAINANTWKAFYNVDGVETGFQIFVWCLSRIFHDPQWLIVISSFIYIFSTTYLIYKTSEDVTISLIMYITLGLLLFEMQGMRQSIAMSICMFAYLFAKQKRLVPFAILVLLAMQFHQTAIVFFAVFPLMYLKDKASNIFLMIIASIVMMYFSKYIINYANNLFDRNYGVAVDSGGFIATAIYLLIISLYLITFKNERKNNLHFDFYILVFASVCYIFRYIGSLAAERISFYFMFSQLIVLPNTVFKGMKKTRDIQLTHLIICLLSILLFLYRLHGSGFVPYKFFFK